jgi:putative DNA primase/helicase
MNSNKATSYDSISADFQPEHLAEFKASAIAPDIADRNFRSFEPWTNPHDSRAEHELDEIFCILIDNPDHINNGTLSGKAQQKLANTVCGGGYLFEGDKGKTVKPNEPRKGEKKKVINDKLLLEIKEKTIKCEAVRGKGNQQVFIPHVSVRVSRLIAKNLDITGYIPSSEDPNAIDINFWNWMKKGNYPIFITEGAKKACSIISNGFPAIGLNGVAGWSNGKDNDGNRLIHQELLPFLEVKRDWVIAFDIDKSPKTVKAVNAEKLAFYNRIKSKASNVTKVKWNEARKGIDDFLASFPEGNREKELYRVFLHNRSEIEELEPNDEETKADKPPRFSSSHEAGLILTMFDSDGKSKNIPVGNHLKAVAYINNLDKDGSSLLLEFKSMRGHVCRWTMPRAELAGDGTQLISQLLSRGYAYSPSKKKDLLTYLHGLGTDLETEYTVTDSSGWVEKSFVLPHRTYGDESICFLDVEPKPDVITETKGDLEGWSQNIGSKCAGNSRLIFAIGAAFAAPLLPVVGMESGGFHFMGATSAGKTTMLKVAASVTGEKQLPSWRTTTNGVEATAVAHNHMLLPLDEIGQADPRQVGEVAYMLGNGQGKARMSKNIAQRKPSKWQLLFLSSGELGMRKYLEQSGMTQKGGQEVRFPDIPAVPHGSPFGLFEAIHCADSAKAFAQYLERACERYRGAAIDAFLSKLIVDRGGNSRFDAELASRVLTIAKSLSEGTVDRAVSRVANRFALVHVALELAHSYGILRFDAENISWAVKRMFGDWLTARGGDGSIEIKQAIERIEHLLVTNEFSDRVMTLHFHNVRGLEADSSTKVRNLLAYRTLDNDGDTDEFWIPPQVFEKDFCGGINKTELVRELQRISWMLPPLLDGRPTHQRRIGKQKSRYFVLKAKNIRDDEKAVGTVGTVGTQAEAPAGKDIQRDIAVPTDKNAMGTVGTDSVFGSDDDDYVTLDEL